MPRAPVYKTSKTDWQSDPHVFVHADDIKTHEQFLALTLTKQFFSFKQDKLSVLQ